MQVVDSRRGIKTETALTKYNTNRNPMFSEV